MIQFKSTLQLLVLLLYFISYRFFHIIHFVSMIKVFTNLVSCIVDRGYAYSNIEPYRRPVCINSVHASVVNNDAKHSTDNEKRDVSS